MAYHMFFFQKDTRSKLVRINLASRGISRNTMHSNPPAQQNNARSGATILSESRNPQNLRSKPDEHCKKKTREGREAKRGA